MFTLDPVVVMQHLIKYSFSSSTSTFLDMLLQHEIGWMIWWFYWFSHNWKRTCSKTPAKNGSLLSPFGSHVTSNTDLQASWFDEGPTHEEKKSAERCRIGNLEAHRCDVDGHKSQNYQFRVFWTLWLVGNISGVYICYMIFPYQLVTSDFRVTDGEIGWMVVWLVNYWIAPI